MAAHRKPPLLEPSHLRCRWCGEAIEPRLKKDGGPCKRQASFHPVCSTEYHGAQNPARLRKEIAVRDGRKCADCGDDRSTTDLDVDHNIPLWKVAHLFDEQRRWYFTLANLLLRCVPCHKRKSAQEAAERAHLKRLNKPRQRRGRKIPSRPFPKKPKGVAWDELEAKFIEETRLPERMR